APEGDGFLARLLPDPVTQRFGLTAGWDTTRGFVIGTGAGLDLSLPLSPAGGGVLTLRTAHLSVSAPEDLQMEVTVDGSARLGPLAVTLEGIGLTADLDLGDPLGALRPQLGFRPPQGAGLTVAAGPVSGGGFLAHDAGRYTGALEVSAGDLALSAFGIVQTEPGGSDFSMVAVVAGRFAPVPLGFGFTLTGVGGILGLHRDVDVDALFAAVRAGTAGEVLSPEDPVADAPRLVDQLGTLFPASRGQHVFGPTVQLGWGSPVQLVGLDLALVLTLPDPLRVVLVGTVRAVLPDPDLAVARLNVDVAGVLDLSASRFDMEGRVYDSVIQALPVTGGFAMRTSWGRDTAFAFAIGGLHPGYTPPAGFPEVDRMGVDLSRGSSFQLRLAGYFAITSNSLQLGARADLKARQGGFSV
ncbi:hypothetical protein PU560_02870, partial [Georgenia sp. 10Sc9-8]|nr:hypothetical protein [Georgenia halotolerans]